jgi:hypothetical protein
MSGNQQTPTDAVVQKEIVAARDALETHVSEVKKALESLQMLARGDISITQFRTLKAALDGFAPAKKAVELGRKIVKRRLQDELNDASATATDKG